MSYSFIDEDGDDGKMSGEGPSINGLRQLKKFLSKQDADFPAMDMLMEHGATHLTLDLFKECKRLAQICTDENVKTTLNALAADAKKAKGCIIMVG